MDYKYDIQVSCRLTYGKFSYFVTDWYLTASADDHDRIRRHIEKRWRIVKGHDALRVDHMRIMRVKERKNA